MIEEISIRNLGVIAEATLPLGAGFTAVTGETGAGKTMVVTALGLLLGDRADSSVLRAGSGAAVVEGQWQVDADGIAATRAQDAGGELDPIDARTASLILGRTISPDGRSRAIVGGRSAPVGVLAELGEHLVVVHGQSDQVRLRSAGAQRDALDRFAGPDLAAVLREYRGALAEWTTAKDELDALVAASDQRAQEAEQLRADMAEIEAAAPRRGEDTELSEQAERLGNLEDLRLAAATARESLSAEAIDGGFDVLGLLDGAKRQLDRAAEHDPALADIAAALAETAILASDIAGRLSSYLSELDVDGGRDLEAVQERRAELGALVRKYGPTLDDTIDRLETGSDRLLELDNDTDRREQLRVAVDEHGIRVADLAGELTRLRTAAAAELAERVSAELSALAMPDAKLSVEISDAEDYTQSGRDQVAILLQPHAGAEPRPLARGASGGELSRVMLAIEVVIAASDPVPTFVFDEVDAGVGGASAIEVGRRLARLAASAQVIVVTHLAQVAAFATNHLRVVKDRSGEVTASSVQQLSGEERIAEMARLLSGLPDSASGLAHARELLDTARALTP
ncbi:DNA repair protein RecN [Parafrigoribacterium mesophilum]|uniref:DNA repair protein RecN n=1 Tax=Parafrigoribacterium mesophilum TaxID=433646 RepID=UPI0031FCF6FA